jgi:pimeloyl-ACP methyl ester carboxylesterase
MHTHLRSLTLSVLILGAAAPVAAQGRSVLPPIPTPTDVKPGSITCDECPYPYPSKYLDISVYSQDVRISYMDVAAQGTANGHTVMLLHGNNFGGFYFKAIIDALTHEGFRVIVPDQIGYGRSSKPMAPYNFNSQARNTSLILQHEKIEKVAVVGHSMGGMLAARFATQYPKAVERLVIYNPIGLTDGRYDRPMTPIDDAYKQTLKTDYQSTRAGLARYVAHNPKAWNDEFEKYTRIRYSWTLSADWPRLAMVQALIGQMLYADPVVYDWAHIQVPTLAFGGAEDMLLGPAKNFQDRMEFLARSVPNGNGRALLLPGLGHVPHLEAPDKVLPPLVAFLKESLSTCVTVRRAGPRARVRQGCRAHPPPGVHRARAAVAPGIPEPRRFGAHRRRLQPPPRDI